MRKLFAALALVAAAGGVRATVGEALPLPGLVEHSERVVLARVRTTQSAWDPGGTRIYTVSQLDVEETVVGAPEGGVQVFQWGGTVGDIGQMVVGETPLTPGDRVVLFLERAQGVPVARAFRCVGMAQGVWRVSRDARGELRVFRRPSSLRLAMPSGRGGAVLLPDAGDPSRPYASLREEVRALKRSRP